MKRNGIDITKGLAMAVLFSGFSAAVNAGDVKAKAEIRLCSTNEIIGEAKLKEKESEEGIKEVEIEMKVKGLSPGKHAVHIHEYADCQPCGEAGGHFDPGPMSYSNPDGNHPFHSGDLINIKSKGDSKGEGKLKTTTSRITLSGGPLSLFDTDGSAFIIHDKKDTYCPPDDNGDIVPGCAGGSRFACGIIEPKD